MPELFELRRPNLNFNILVRVIPAWAESDSTPANHHDHGATGKAPQLNAVTVTVTRPGGNDPSPIEYY